MALGIGLSLLQKYTGLVRLAQAESFIIDAYPIAIRVFDIGLILVVALGLCVLAAVYPARRAAAVEPAMAVRSSG
jgi:lipoprotein-releasing system permease protein